MTLPDDWTDEIQTYADSVWRRIQPLGARRVCADAFAYTVIRLRDLGFGEAPIVRVTTPLLSLHTEAHEQVWRIVRSIVQIATTVQAHHNATDAQKNAAVMSYVARVPAADA